MSGLSGCDLRPGQCGPPPLMGKTVKKFAAALALAAAFAVAAPATAQPGGDYRYQGGGYGGGYGLQLQGLRVDQAKQQLASAGYQAARNIRYDGRQYDLWSNSRSRNSCVGFTSYKGTVSDARSFSDADCGVVSGGGWGGRGIDASDLQGMRVDDAKRNLRDYGYSNTRNVRLNGKQWDLWLDGRGRDCIGFTSYKGTISGVQSFRGYECSSNGTPGGGYWIQPRDLEGLSVDQAKRSLADAGFRGARNIRIDGHQWDLFHDDNGRSDLCVGFTSYKGRVTEADDFSPRDCR